MKLEDENNDEVSFLGTSKSSAAINDLTQGNVSKLDIDTNLSNSSIQRETGNVFASGFNDNPDNKVKIFDVANDKVKKYGPVNRWRDIPRSTTELKIMPTKWIPDEREQIKRTFTVTCTFESPTGSCDFGPREPFQQQPSTTTTDPETGQTSTFTPALGCGQPCCPPQPNEQMTWSYTKYFVNNFSNAANRWSNIIKTYNDHPSNANWSFL